MEEKNLSQNKMGVMPMNRLLISMAVPMMISMLVQALYNIVDSYFVAQLSEAAFTAVSLAFPVQNIIIAVGAGTGVGINALLSKSLGEGKRQRASRAACNGLFLSVCYMGAALLMGLFFVEPFYASQVANEPEIMEYGRQYLTVICCFSQGCFLQITLERLLQATGNTTGSMISQLTGAIINIVLDPIFIFGLGPVPALGVMGAAVATVLGQYIGAGVAIWLNMTRNRELGITLRGCFRPEGEIIRGIYTVGIPSIVMSSIGSVMYYGMNRILLPFTVTASAVFGVYFKVQSFFFMPVFGMNNAVVPIIAFNYGAQKRKRMVTAVKLSIFYATCIMLLGMAVMHLFTPQILGLFEASETMLAIGVPALKTISLSFIFAGFCIAGGTVFQALGKGTYSLINSVIRQLAVLLSVAWLLSRTGELDAVWWAFPIAELFSLTVTGLFLRRIFRKIINKVPEGE